MIMTAPVSESAAPAFDVEIPHTAGVASSREPTLPSVPIVSMHDSNTTTTRAGGGALREPVMGRTTTKRKPDTRLCAAIVAVPKF